jgi:hypothetical protein
MQDTLCLLPNGTGHLQSESVIRGSETFPVMWKHIKSGTLLISVLWPEDDPGVEPEWETVCYSSARVMIDMGGILVNVLRNIENQEFWMLTGPIQYISSA